MKTNVLQNFHICISVPLNLLIAFFTLSVCECSTFSFTNWIFKTQKLSRDACFLLRAIEGVSVTIGNPAFCLTLYLTGVYLASSNDQSELEKWVMSDCQRNCMYSQIFMTRRDICFNKLFQKRGTHKSKTLL